ncbi:MAG: ABC transporter permease [Phycisphaerales bacterium]
MILNLYKHRGYIWRTAISEVRNRYAGAGLGVVWNFIQPLALIGIFTIVFTGIMPGRGQGMPVAYPVYLCAALLPWFAFSDCLQRCTNAFVANAAYLRKLPIPEQVFVAQAALSSAINLAISFTLLLVFALALRHWPTWHWLLIPVPLALLIAFAFGVGMVLGTLNAFIRDIGQAVPILVGIGFWTYPVVYHKDHLPQWAQAALPWNPVYPFLEALRELFIYDRMPPLWLWPAMLAWTAAAGLLGYLVLRRLRRELRDVI